MVLIAAERDAGKHKLEGAVASGSSASSEVPAWGRSWP